MRAFAHILRDALKMRGLTHKAFALRVGVTRSRVSQIAAGMPTDWRQADTWADALGLTSREREAFLDAMHLASASPRVQRMVDRLRADAGRSD